MNPQLFDTLKNSPDFDHFVKTNWTVSRGLRPAQLPPRVSRKSPYFASSLAGSAPRVPDMSLLEMRAKACVLNQDYKSLLQTAKQILEIDSHSAAGWLHTGVALLGQEGVSSQTPFLQIENLSPQKRIQINAALRALHTAGTCHASAASLAEIYVMKALGRFSLGQLQGAYHDLQFALRHAPSFALARELMQTPAMQALHRKHIAAPHRSKPAPMRAV